MQYTLVIIGPLNGNNFGHCEVFPYLESEDDEVRVGKNAAIGIDKALSVKHALAVVALECLVCTKDF